MNWPFPWNLLRAIFRDKPSAEYDDLSIDSEGWLAGPLVELVPSVRHSPLTIGPVAIVWHYTATKHGTARALARRIRSYKKGVDRAASWHVCIAHDGVLWQSVPFTRGAWHCGKGTIQASQSAEEHRVNRCSVGIELEGNGDRFPLSQILASIRLVRTLVSTYPIQRSHAGHGHSQFDPDRRSDPGPVWEAELPGVLDAAFSGTGRKGP